MKKEKAPRQISIVGRNLYAALALDTLIKEEGVQLSWLQHAKDVELRESPHWLYFPDLRKLSFPFTEAIFVKPEKISVYVNNSKRVPLPRFLEDGMAGPKGSVYPHVAIRNKIYATAIWNDLTPSLWTKEAPNTKWPRQLPHSMKIKNWAGAALLPREKSLLAAEEIFQKEGVSIAPRNKHVLSLELGRLGDDNHLLHNAPHSYTRSQYTVWNNPNYAKLKAQRPVKARWRSFHAEVDKQLLSPLPLISIWLHQDHESEFMETGLISNGCMSRVIVIPQRGKSTDLLHIQELEFLPFKQSLPTERIDKFLWEVCPYLEREDLSFHCTSSDEDSIFEEPDEILEKIGRKSFFYWQGPMGDPEAIKGKLS